MKVSRSSRAGNTSSAQSSASQHSLAPTQPANQSPSAWKKSSGAKRSSQRILSSSDSSSSVDHQRTPVLNISDSSSSSDIGKPSSTLCRRKPKNLFDNLGDLLTSRTGKAPSFGPLSKLGKRPALEPHHDLREPKMGKHPAKFADSPSTWLEDCPLSQALPQVGRVCSDPFGIKVHPWVRGFLGLHPWR